MLWNWKTALSSGLYRAPAFALLTSTPNWARPALIEFAVAALVAGFAGAVVQRLRRAAPVRAALVILVALPALLHASEFAAHSLYHTPGRRRALLVSLLMTALAEAFNWHAMRHSALLAGPGSPSLWQDLARMPSLIWQFLLILIRFHRNVTRS